MRFPADIPFGLAMEAVDTDGRLGDPVQFLDGPALVAGVADILPGAGGGCFSVKNSMATFYEWFYIIHF
ncbi:MAG: hypothetical protein OXC82_09570 [Rhodobacteraceae bacterium]|nr:hypothetical protein [Paracoccaceae bacterium]MCY4250664.1 hypothetical protein [Paracoccaceae bacterium]